MDNSEDDRNDNETFHSDTEQSETEENSSNDEATENFWDYKRSKIHSGNNGKKKPYETYKRRNT